MNSKVLGIGSALVDVLLQVDDDFLHRHVHGAKGGMEMVTSQWQKELLSAVAPADRVLMPGGAAGNTVFALASLGIPAAMYSKTGKDEHGRFYRRCLVEAGGLDAEFKETDEADTGCCISLITPDSQRTMRSYLGASQLSTPEDAAGIDFSGYTLVYIEGYTMFLPGFVQEVMKQAKRAGCQIALDLASFEVVNIFRPEIERLLKQYADIVFANEDEAKALFGGGMSEEAMASELAKWCTAAAVKRGERGAVIASGDKIYSVPAKPVKAVDTTGAGDIWAAGFLYGYLAGLPLPACGYAGAEAAAEVVKVIGARLPADTWQMLKNTIVQTEKWSQ